MKRGDWDEIQKEKSNDSRNSRRSSGSPPYKEDRNGKQIYQAAEELYKKPDQERRVEIQNTWTYSYSSIGRRAMQGEEISPMKSRGTARPPACRLTTSTKFSEMTPSKLDVLLHSA